VGRTSGLSAVTSGNQHFGKFPGENLPSNGKSELLGSLIGYSWPKDIFPYFAKDPATLEVKPHDK